MSIAHKLTLADPPPHPTLNHTTILATSTELFSTLLPTGTATASVDFSQTASPDGKAHEDNLGIYIVPGLIAAIIVVGLIMSLFVKRREKIEQDIEDGWYEPVDNEPTSSPSKSSRSSNIENHPLLARKKRDKATDSVTVSTGEFTQTYADFASYMGAAETLLEENSTELIPLQTFSKAIQKP